MRSRTSIALLTLLGFMRLTDAQAKPISAYVLSADHQHSPISSTYDDTLHLLKEWENGGRDAADHAEAVLLKEGNTRAADLLAACTGTRGDVPYLAFDFLRFLNVDGIERCAGALERKYGGLLYSGAAGLSDFDLDRIDRWLAQKRTPNGYNCDVCKRIFPPAIDDALVYALILNGSTRARSILKRAHAFADSCMGGDVLFLIRSADSLIAPAKEMGHGLNIEPNIGESVRASAFFLPAESRVASKSMVQVLSRSNNRILLKIRYHVGFFGGGIYYVVLMRDGPLWQYALITKVVAF